MDEKKKIYGDVLEAWEIIKAYYFLERKLEETEWFQYFKKKDYLIKNCKDKAEERLVRGFLFGIEAAIECRDREKGFE